MQCTPNLGLRLTFRNTSVLILTLSCLILVLTSCSAWMKGWTQRDAMNRFLLVDQTNESFGYKRLDYNQGFYPMLKHFLALRGIPELIYEFETDDKKEGIRLIYVKQDTVYEFVKMGFRPDSLLMKEQRHLTEYEKATYQELNGKDLTVSAKPGQKVLTRADLDSLVASQRYDTVIAFLHTPHDAQTLVWLQPWWLEKMKEAHVPLIYELAFQTKDPEKSMQVYGIAYVGTVLDGCLCTEPAVNRFRVSMLQQYMKAWPLRTNSKSSGDFGQSFTSAVQKGLVFYAGIYGRKSKTPYPGWACREAGIYDQPGGTVTPEGEWDSTRSVTLKRFNEIMTRDLVVAVTTAR